MTPSRILVQHSLERYSPRVNNDSPDWFGLKNDSSQAFDWGIQMFVGREFVVVCLEIFQFHKHFAQQRVSSTPVTFVLILFRTRIQRNRFRHRICLISNLIVIVVPHMRDSPVSVEDCGQHKSLKILQQTTKQFYYPESFN